MKIKENDHDHILQKSIVICHGACFVLSDYYLFLSGQRTTKAALKCIMVNSFKVWLYQNLLQYHLLYFLIDNNSSCIIEKKY